MGKRSTGRRLAMQALYQSEVGKFSIEEALEQTYSNEEFQKNTKKFAGQLAKGVILNLQKIDELIAKNAKDWKFERLSEVDKSILRLAIHELRFARENPPAVIINEAVELAKKYSSPEASKFVNGILGSVLKEK